MPFACNFHRKGRQIIAQNASKIASEIAPGGITVNNQTGFENDTYTGYLCDTFINRIYISLCSFGVCAWSGHRYVHRSDYITRSGSGFNQWATACDVCAQRLHVKTNLRCDGRKRSSVIPN